MIISKDVVGKKIISSPFELQARDSMAFAAGLMSDRSDYFSSHPMSKQLAPPSICAVHEWKVINTSQFADCLGIGSESLHRGIHLVQDTRFSVPLSYPQKLYTTAEILAVMSTRIGTLVEIRFTNKSCGTDEILSVTDWSSIYIGIDCVESGEGSSRTRKSNGEGDYSSGTQILRIPSWFPHSYSECSGIWNPVHTEYESARRQGLAGIIVHGSALWALVGEMIIDRFCAGNPCALKRLSCTFKNAVEPGSSVYLQFGSEVADPKRSWIFQMTDRSKSRVFLEGKAEVDL